MKIEVIQDILTTLEKHNVARTDIYDALNETLKYANLMYWEDCTVSVSILYALKDTVWYNLEHLPKGGSSEGMTSLVHLGSYFPIFANMGTNDVYVSSEDVVKLSEELTQIVGGWSSDFNLVRLKISDRTHLLEKPENVRVLLMDNTRSLGNPMGNMGYNLIVDGKGKAIERGAYIQGTRENKVGDINSSIIYTTLSKLNISVQRAKSNKKGLRLELDDYE